MKKIVFVCLGNICRSPAAHAVLEHLLDKDPWKEEIVVDSCGLGNWHEGEGSDPRMIQVAQAENISMTHKARQIKALDFSTCSYILAADKKVYDDLIKLAPSSESKGKIHMMTAFSIFEGEDIEVPYFGDLEDFEDAFGRIKISCQGFLDYLKKIGYESTLV